MSERVDIPFELQSLSNADLLVLDKVMRLSMEQLLELRWKLRPHVQAELARRLDVVDFKEQAETSDVVSEIDAFLESLTQIEGDDDAVGS